MIERREEHDCGIGDRLGEVVAAYRHVDRAEEGEVAEGQREQLQEDATGAEDVGRVGAVETSVATSAVARREDEAAAHIVHTLAPHPAATLDARRRRHDALHLGDEAARQAVAPIARDVTSQTTTGTRTRTAGSSDAAVTRHRRRRCRHRRRFLFLGTIDAQTDVPGSRLRKGHVYISRLGCIHIYIRRCHGVRANASATRGDVGVMTWGELINL